MDKKLINLKPGIAGYIIDGKVHNKEIIATIVDLIVREYIDFYPKNANWEELKVKRLLLLKSRSSLKFEEEFLHILFNKKKEITISELKTILIKGTLHKLLESYVKESGVYLDVKDEKVDFYLENPKNTVSFSVNGRPVRNVEDWQSFKFTSYIMGGVFGLFILFFLASAAINYFIAGIVPNKGYLMAILFFAFMIFLFVYLPSKTTKIATQNIKYTDKNVKNLRKKYHELFDFLKKHPLKEGRLFNEYLPYSIAFGLDTHWQEAFSILFAQKEEFTFKDSK